MAQLVIESNDERLFKLSFKELVMYQLLIKPLFENRIITILVEGESGSGKSMFSLWLAYTLERIFAKVTGKNYEFDPDKQIIYIPQQYSDRLDEWTKNKYVTLVLDELRFLLPKQKWQSLLNQSIAETNAVIRDVKLKYAKHGGIIIYNTQDISDITKDARKTISFDFQTRTKSTYVKAIPLQFWLDKRNIEKPTLRFKKVKVTIGKYSFIWRVIYPPLPPTHIRKKFKELSVKYKLKILEQKRQTVMKEINKEYRPSNFRDVLFDDKTFEIVSNLINIRKNKITISPENKEILCKFFNITKTELKKEFIPALYNVINEKGLI